MGATSSSSFFYDALDRVRLEERAQAGQQAYSVRSQYDLEGNREKCIYPETGRVLTFGYDRLDRLVLVADSTLQSPTSFAYDANGNRQSSLRPNGDLDSFVYDDLNRVTSALTTPTSGPTIYSAGHSYDLAGNRLSVDEQVVGHPQRLLTYAYDDQYRLISESWPGHVSTFAYDAAGNRIGSNVDGVAASFTYNSRNELLVSTVAGASTTFTYDRNGNLAERTVGANPPARYTFDVSNRLVAVDTDGDSLADFTATYDYRVRRQSVTEGTDTTFYRYDGGVSIQRRKNGALTAEYVRGGGMGGGIGSILYSDRMMSGGTIEAFCLNPVGHTVALTDMGGLVTSSNLYSAFGGIFAASGSAENDFLANTKQRSASIGLDNHGFRYYDPEIGRYISRDPAGYPDGLNAYLYVRNNPINRVGPLGLSEKPKLTRDQAKEMRKAAWRAFRNARNSIEKELAAGRIHGGQSMDKTRTYLEHLGKTLKKIDSMTVKPKLDVDQLESDYNKAAVYFNGMTGGDPTDPLNAVDMSGARDEAHALLQTSNMATNLTQAITAQAERDFQQRRAENPEGFGMMSNVLEVHVSQDGVTGPDMAMIFDVGEGGYEGIVTYPGKTHVRFWVPIVKGPRKGELRVLSEEEYAEHNITLDYWKPDDEAE